MFETIKKKVTNGQEINEADALYLFEKADLKELQLLADEVKNKMHGKKVYYVNNRQINYTNICILKCKFCAFSKIKPDSPEAYDWTIDEIVNKADEAVSQGARELHIVGGLHPDHSFEYYIRLLDTLHKKFPEVHLKAFTAVEIRHFVKISNLSIEEVLRKLMSVGLVSLTGGGAEILDAEVRKEICSPKDTSEEWVEVHSKAHEIGLVSNATMLFGHVEEYRHRVNHLKVIRNLQNIHHGFNSFIPLVFHPENTYLQKRVPEKTPVEDRLRTIAVSRIYLNNIPHIKAYWVQLGLDVAAEALHFGASDLDGTILEEKITKAAGSAVFGLSVKQLRDIVANEGLEACERDALYNSFN